MSFLRRARLASILALLAFAVPLHALDLKSLKPQGYLSDFAGVVDPQSRAAIEQYAAAIEHSTGAQMSFVTLKTLDGDPLEDVSIDLFRQFGIGQKGKDNGVQLLLVTDDHRSRLEVGNGLEPILPDGLDGQILLDMRPQLQAGDYGQAILAAAQRIGAIIAKDKGVQVAAPAVQPSPAPRPVPRASPGSEIPWGLLIFVVILLIGMFRRGSSARRSGGGFWPGFLIGNALGGGWSGGGGGFGGFSSGGSGGGFGGSGSGGGFGGFGGGDAGGGGASSSW